MFKPLIAVSRPVRDRYILRRKDIWWILYNISPGDTSQCNLDEIYIWLILYLYQHCQQKTTILIGLDETKKDEYWTVCLILISI